MAKKEDRTDKLLDWVAEHRILAAALVLVVGLFGLFLAGLGGDRSPPDTLATPPTTTAATSIAPTADPDRPEVPQVTCDTLITTDEADEALYGEFDGTSGPRGLIVVGGSETCVFQADDDSENYLQIEPGDPADFETGASLEGVSGESVEGIGDAARWFDDGSSGLGVLTVGADVEVGSLIYRINVRRTELNVDERLDVAKGLALAALPRFPGVVVEAPEPETITFEEESVDLPPLNLGDVLFQGVENGDWTLDEGLVELLDWMVNDTPGVVEVELPDPSATAVVSAAQGYIAGDGEKAAEVESLLDQLIFSPEDLASRAESASTPDFLVSLVPLAQEDDEPDCVGTVENPCFTEVSLAEFDDLEEGKHEMWVAGPSPWGTSKVKVVKEAYHAALVDFEKLNYQVPTVLVLRHDKVTVTTYTPATPTCQVGIGSNLAVGLNNDLVQIIAREVAFCFVRSDLFLQLYENPNPWIENGLATYLSGVVFPNNNWEHKMFPGPLASQELSTNLSERSDTNWAFFEHIHGFGGVLQTMDLLRGLPEGGNLVAGMAALPGMESMHHDYALALSDSSVIDLGSGTVPYDPPAWELPISGPSEVTFSVPQFGTRRLHIKVPPGEFACVTDFALGSVMMSRRPGAPGDGSGWSTELPESFEGEVVLVVTSVDPGADYSLEVNAVGDNPDCEEDEPDDGGSADLPFGPCLDFCDPSTYYWGPLNFEN